MSDLRLMLEDSNSRNNLLEKKQRKYVGYNFFFFCCKWKQFYTSSYEKRYTVILMMMPPSFCKLLVKWAERDERNVISRLIKFERFSVRVDSIRSCRCYRKNCAKRNKTGNDWHARKNYWRRINIHSNKIWTCVWISERLYITPHVFYFFFHLYDISLPPPPVIYCSWSLYIFVSCWTPNVCVYLGCETGSRNERSKTDESEPRTSGNYVRW